MAEDERRMNKDEFMHRFSDSVKVLLEDLKNDMDKECPEWYKQNDVILHIISQTSKLYREAEMLYDLTAYYFEVVSGKAWCEEEDEEEDE